MPLRPTGVPVLVIADNGYLTDLRTGLAGAISIDTLANQDVQTVAVIGTGIQARHQLRSLLLVRSPSQVMIWGRDSQRADALHRDASDMADWDVSVAGSVHEATRYADVVITTTPATSPFLYGEDLKSGVHVTAVGSDSPGKRELDVSALNLASVIAADDPVQSAVRGELQAIPDSVIPVVKLGNILTSSDTGRTSTSDVTICDLIGIGAEDAAIGSLVARIMLS